VDAPRMRVVRALDLLQKNQIGIKQAQMLTHLVDDHAAAKKRESFVDIVGADV
jgi:hypothetical protein